MAPMDPRAHLRHPSPEALASWAVEDCAHDAAPVAAALAMLCRYATELLAGGADDDARCYARAATYLRRWEESFTLTIAA